MQISDSKFIALESIALCDLFKLEAGAVGLYIPNPDDEGRIRNNIAKISANAKAYAVKAGKKCVVNTIMCLEHEGESELPFASKMLKVTVTDKESLTLGGERYMKARESSQNESAK